MIWLLVFAYMGALWFFYKLGWGERMLDIPYMGGIEIGVYFIPLFIFVIVAAANSVNITDGLDGLAGGLLLFSYAVYTFITFDQ